MNGSESLPPPAAVREGESLSQRAPSPPARLSAVGAEGAGAPRAVSADSVPLRQPPHDTAAEQAILGGLIRYPEQWDKVEGRLSEADFFLFAHRIIFKTISILAEQNHPIDLASLESVMQEQGTLEQAGGFAYLGDLSFNAASSVIEYYVERVRDRAKRRELIALSIRVQDTAFNDFDATSTDLTEQLYEGLSAMDAEGGMDRLVPIKEDLRSTLDALAVRCDLHKEGKLIGLTTGFADLDKRTGGLRSGDFVVVAGRPSMGKTTFAMNLGTAVAEHEHLPVLVFSAEMPREQLLDRLISAHGNIPHENIRNGDITESQWPLLTSATLRLKDMPLYIDDHSSPTLAHIRSKARALKRLAGGRLGAIVIDYLQLVDGSLGRKGATRQDEIAALSRGFKKLAKEMEVPVIALSQLNRELERRPNKRPLMSDLRESGAIEQDADVIIFIYRDEVYNPDTEDRGKAEIIVAKGRNVQVGTVPVATRLDVCRFEDLAFGRDQPIPPSACKDYYDDDSNAVRFQFEND